MTNQVIIILAMCFSYYHIAGLATTNILRLTKENTLNILSSTCVCDNCGSKISPILQFPIVSYIVCKGRCKNCKIKIPIFGLIIEITVLGGILAISFIFKFSMLSVLLNFIYYEIIRIVVIFYKGRRKNNFIREYLIATLMSMIHFSLVSLMAFLKLHV